jgi:HEAT repeat protein
MRKRRRVLHVISVIALLLSGLVWCVLRSREPVYQGKPLIVWLDAYRKSRYLQEENGIDTEAEQYAQQAAIRQIGTKAIPHLLQLLQTKDSGIKSNAIVMLKRQSFVHTLPRTDIEFHNLALAGFQALGPVAKPAVPALIGMLDNPCHRYSAALCLGRIGPAAGDAVRRLLPWLDEEDVALRYCAANALGGIGRGTLETTSALLKHLNDTNQFVRGSVELALGKLRAEPGVVVPILIQELRTDPTRLSRSRIRALGAFGAEAKQAVPLLLELFRSNSADLGLDIASALKAIDPEAAAKAGMK